MDTINWEDVYVQLYAYTDQLLKAHQWFRKGKSDSFLKGKQVHDYVADAIEKYLSAPEKYNPSTNRSLVNYLKLHIIRTLVGNDANSSENRTSLDIFALNDTDDDPFENIEFFLPYANIYFDQEMDYNKILSDVKMQLKGDETACKIFDCVCCNGMKRREVILEHNLQDPDFDNGMKRLRTVLKNTAKKYDLN